MDDFYAARSGPIPPLPWPTIPPPFSGVNVPQDAVQTLGDRSVVFVRTRQGFKAQTVRVGTRSGGMVEIASGLPANTVIATTNAFLLKAELGKGSAE